ncbi:MAG: type II secretion system protein [Nitrospira sp.]|nr:type II secretion system protein [Nitrospira sp.]
MGIRPASLKQAERGFSYLMLMIAIVVMGIVMSVAARQWKVMVQRELEADLLTKGIEIQNALAFYSASMKAGRVMPGEVYPQTLADLTRQPKPFLRKVYGDPVGHGEWEVVRAPTGGIMGVRSKSKSKPIRQQNFPLVVRHFQGKPTYYDWVFQHPSPSGSVVNPLGTPLQPGLMGQPTAPGAPAAPTPPASGTPLPPAPPPIAAP